MLNLICLSFLELSSGSSAHIPEQVDQLVKSRLKQQLSAKHPELELRFNDKECPNQVQMKYLIDSLVLEANHEVWNGRAEYQLTDILDGRSLSFPLAVKAETASLPLALPREKEAAAYLGAAPRKWIPWAIATVAAGVVAGVVYNKNKKPSAESRGGPSKGRTF